MIKFYTIKQSQSPPKKQQIKPKKLQQEQFLYRYRKIKQQRKLSPIQNESHTLNTLVHSPELFPKNQSVSVERCSINDRVIINYLKPLHIKQKQFEYNLVKGVTPSLQSQHSKSTITQRQRKFSYSNETKSIDIKPLNSKRADSLNLQIFQPSRWTHTTFVSEF